jgi:hypothetical protein
MGNTSRVVGHDARCQKPFKPSIARTGDLQHRTRQDAAKEIGDKERQRSQV